MRPRPAVDVPDHSFEARTRHLLPQAIGHRGAIEGDQGAAGDERIDANRARKSHHQTRPRQRPVQASSIDDQTAGWLDGVRLKGMRPKHQAPLGTTSAHCLCGLLDPGAEVDMLARSVPGHLADDQDVFAAVLPGSELDAELCPSIRGGREIVGKAPAAVEIVEGDKHMAVSVHEAALEDDQRAAEPPLVPLELTEGRTLREARLLDAAANHGSSAGGPGSVDRDHAMLESEIVEAVAEGFESGTAVGRVEPVGANDLDRHDMTSSHTLLEVSNTSGCGRAAACQTRSQSCEPDLALDQI